MHVRKGESGQADLGTQIHTCSLALGRVLAEGAHLWGEAV